MAEAFMNADEVPPLIGDVDALLDRLQRFHGHDPCRANDLVVFDDRRRAPTRGDLFDIMRAADRQNAKVAA